MSLFARSPRPLKQKWLWFAIIAVLLIAAGLYALRYDFQSYAVLIHFLDPQASNLLLRWETHPVVTQEVTLPLSHGSARARLYLPGGVAKPRGMVVVHGIHHLGMDEACILPYARAVQQSQFPN